MLVGDQRAPDLVARGPVDLDDSPLTRCSTFIDRSFFIVQSCLGSFCEGVISVFVSLVFLILLDLLNVIYVDSMISFVVVLSVSPPAVWR